MVTDVKVTVTGSLSANGLTGKFGRGKFSERGEKRRCGDDEAMEEETDGGVGTKKRSSRWTKALLG